MTQPIIDLAGLVSRSLKLNDAQWARGEITHEVWSETYIALANYATAHGVAAGTFGLMPDSRCDHGHRWPDVFQAGARCYCGALDRDFASDEGSEYAAYLAGERPDPRD